MSVSLVLSRSVLLVYICLVYLCIVIRYIIESKVNLIFLSGDYSNAPHATNLKTYIMSTRKLEKNNYASTRGEAELLARQYGIENYTELSDLKLIGALARAESIQSWRRGVEKNVIQSEAIRRMVSL